MTDSEFGKRVKEIRLKRGISTTHFCNKAGKSIGWLRRRENGTTPIYADELDIFADVLCVTVEQIFGVKQFIG
jgi:transcriptional regulator with XRE-family HTH domain